MKKIAIILLISFCFTNSVQAQSYEIIKRISWLDAYDSETNFSANGNVIRKISAYCFEVRSLYKDKQLEQACVDEEIAQVYINNAGLVAGNTANKAFVWSKKQGLNYIPLSLNELQTLAIKAISSRGEIYAEIITYCEDTEYYDVCNSKAISINSDTFAVKELLGSKFSTGFQRIISLSTNGDALISINKNEYGSSIRNLLITKKSGRVINVRSPILRNDIGNNYHQAILLPGNAIATPYWLQKVNSKGKQKPQPIDQNVKHEYVDRFDFPSGQLNAMWINGEINIFGSRGVLGFRFTESQNDHNLSCLTPRNLIDSRFVAVLWANKNGEVLVYSSEGEHARKAVYLLRPVERVQNNFCLQLDIEVVGQCKNLTEIDPSADSISLIDEAFEAGYDKCLLSVEARDLETNSRISNLPIKLTYRGTDALVQYSSTGDNGEAVAFTLPISSDLYSYLISTDSSKYQNDTFYIY